jgi:hypothetical protein
VSGITVGQAGDLLVAVKHAHDPDQRARLRHEADLLGRLDHPGVVRLVDFQEGPPTALRTAFVGPDSWRTSRADTAAFAALTATIADLHDSGLAHGDLRADHVLLDSDQRPILCGFAEAGPANAERMQADRSALAAMLRDGAADQPAAVAHRLRDAAEVLDEPALPTRAAIRLLDDRAPEPTDVGRSRPSGAMIATVLGAIAALTLVGMTATALLGRGDATPPPTVTESAETSNTPSPNTGTQTADPAPPTTDTALPRPVAPAPAAPTEPATILEHEGRRYGVGAVGDLVHVADWTCSGEATPAVLRPDSGELAVFTTWPEPDASLLPAVIVVVDEAIDFAIDDQPCPELRIRTARGSRLIEVPA